VLCIVLKKIVIIFRHHVLFGSGNVDCAACEVTTYF